MLARHVTVHGDPAQIDEALRVQREFVIPVLHQCEGFVAQLVLVDRAAGDVIGMLIWASQAHMDASEDRILPARRQVGEALHATGSADVRLLELAIFDQG